MIDLSAPSKILITCSKGVAPILAEEVRALNLSVLAESAAGIETRGSISDAMRLNLHIRTGHRVMYHLATFRAATAADMYGQVLDLPWEDLIEPDGYLSVSSSVDNPSITDSRFANLKCKDAIVDRVKMKQGKRPDSGPDASRAVVNLYWRGDVCTVSLDTSGEPLSKRGYRKMPWKAPMQETLAAAVVMATEWNGAAPFINPMCGSGTLAIEAALLALNRAPGLLRQNYGFMHLRGFDGARWEEMRRDALSAARETIDCEIIAGDHSGQAVEAASVNAALAGVGHYIRFSVSDFRETPVPPGPGVIMINPEYGARLGREDRLGDVYRAIGDFLKQRGKGYRGYVFTGNPGLAKSLGLKAKRRLPFYNGAIECRLLEYELYPGSRR